MEVAKKLEDEFGRDKIILRPRAKKLGMFWLVFIAHINYLLFIKIFFKNLYCKSSKVKNWLKSFQFYDF